MWLSIQGLLRIYIFVTPFEIQKILLPTSGNKYCLLLFIFVIAEAKKSEDSNNNQMKESDEKLEDIENEEQSSSQDTKDSDTKAEEIKEDDVSKTEETILKENNHQKLSVQKSEEADDKTKRTLR